MLSRLCLCPRVCSLSVCRPAAAPVWRRPQEAVPGVQLRPPAWLPGGRRGRRPHQAQETGESCQSFKKSPRASPGADEQLQTVTVCAWVSVCLTTYTCVESEGIFLESEDVQKWRDFGTWEHLFRNWRVVRITLEFFYKLMEFCFTFVV